MIGALVITHGQVATELVNAARKIMGPIDHMRAVSVDWDDDADQARQRIVTAIREVETSSGVLILTDMFGGTPTNIALTFLEKDRIEVVTGVNLPMVLKLAGLKPTETLAEAALKVRVQGQKNIYVASEVLAGTEG